MINRPLPGPDGVDAECIFEFFLLPREWPFPVTLNSTVTFFSFSSILSATCFLSHYKVIHRHWSFYGSRKKKRRGNEKKMNISFPSENTTPEREYIQTFSAVFEDFSETFPLLFFCLCNNIVTRMTLSTEEEVLLLSKLFPVYSLAI